MDRPVRKAVIGLVLILLVAGLSGVLLREPITQLATWFLERFGLVGIFAGVVLTDTSILPLTNEPLLLLATSAGVDAWPLFAVSAVASTLAGPLGYGLGYLAGSTGLRDWIRGREPRFEAFMLRYGAWGVAVAALLPIPFAFATWSAGMTRVSFPHVLLASLVRVPKTAIYLLLIVQGWAVGA